MLKKQATLPVFALLLLAAATSLTNCGGVTAASPIPKYRLVISPTGQIYRLDETSGEVALIEHTPIISIGMVKLAIGSFYEAENGKVLRYTGDGKFVLRPTLDEIFKQTQSK